MSARAIDAIIEEEMFDGQKRATQRIRPVSTFRVRIDGEITWLRLHLISGSRGYCYLTPGNTREHHFQEPLQIGQRFTTSGHFYEVLASRDEE